MFRLFLCFICWLSLLASVFAKPPVNPPFQQIFTRWTEAFNHKNLPDTCGLFSKQLSADYQGASHKNYAVICNGFKKIFAQKNKRYLYHFALHQIYYESTLAAVRITWYLSIYQGRHLISTVRDEGLDIFAKNARGKWQIVNYLGYPYTKIHA